ncbi:MAG: hypothetical protein ACLSHC_09785 [Bilophila wadsworthia]
MERSAAVADPAWWPSDLAGKRVILRWNGKHNGDLLLITCTAAVPRFDTEFIKAYETDPPSAAFRDLPESRPRRGRRTAP